MTSEAPWTPWIESVNKLLQHEVSGEINKESRLMEIDRLNELVASGEGIALVLQNQQDTLLKLRPKLPELEEQLQPIEAQFKINDARLNEVIIEKDMLKYKSIHVAKLNKLCSKIVSTSRDPNDLKLNILLKDLRVLCPEVPETAVVRNGLVFLEGVQSQVKDSSVSQSKILGDPAVEFKLLNKPVSSPNPQIMKEVVFSSEKTPTVESINKRIRRSYDDIIDDDENPTEEPILYIPTKKEFVLLLLQLFFTLNPTLTREPRNFEEQTALRISESGWNLIRGQVFGEAEERLFENMLKTHLYYIPLMNEMNICDSVTWDIKPISKMHASLSQKQSGSFTILGNEKVRDEKVKIKDEREKINIERKNINIEREKARDENEKINDEREKINIERKNINIEREKARDENEKINDEKEKINNEVKKETIGEQVVRAESLPEYKPQDIVFFEDTVGFVDRVTKASNGSYSYSIMLESGNACNVTGNQIRLSTVDEEEMKSLPGTPRASFMSSASDFSDENDDDIVDDSVSMVRSEEVSLSILDRAQLRLKSLAQIRKK